MTGNSKKVNKFGMLLKNDFLASARVISLFYLAEAAAVIAFLIGDHFDIKKVMIIGLVCSLVVAFLLIFVSLFFVVYDYQKSLFGPQGYLSFSLPVTSNQLLGSKMIVYGAWMVVSFLLFVGVVDYFSGYLETDIVGESTVNTASSLLTMFMGFPTKAQIIIYAVYFMIYFFVLVLSIVSMIYFAIAASHMRSFQKANIIWAVVIFIINLIVLVAAVSVLEKYIDIYLVVGDDKSFFFSLGAPDADSGLPLSLTPLTYFIAQGIALFFATSYVMHKKINIK